MSTAAGTTQDLGLVRDLTLPHLDAAYNLARWLMGGEQDAADLVHTAFLRAARYIHTYAGGNARAWWLSIVRNCCLAKLAGRERHNVSLELIADNEPDAMPHTGRADIEEAAHLSQCASLVMEHLQAMPREFREVLVLREIEDCSYREIADILAVPVGTVMSRLARARSSLRKTLMEDSSDLQAHGLTHGL
jgi:RNA polymerase sigma-70 factor (ECF subfamily)